MALDSFDVAVFEKHLTAKEFGKRFIYKDITETTMDDALKAAHEGTPNGTAIMAERQSKARGTKNRKWNALNTGNIYISYVYYRTAVLEDPLRDECLMEVSGSLAVYTALLDFGVKDIKLKWLNDVWVRGHKMAGVLVEDKGPHPTDANKRLCIVGIGVNINADVRRNPELYKISTSARCQLGGTIVNREKFLAKMSQYLEEFLSLSMEELFQKAIRYQLFQLGDPVKVHSELGGEVTDGTIVEFLQDWSIRLKDNSGKVWTAIADNYTLRPCVTSTVYVYNGKLACTWSSAALLKSLSSLVDTTHTAVALLNDAKIKEGVWRKDTAILAVGEISIVEADLEVALQTMTELRSFTDDGGILMMTGNSAAIFSLFLQSDSAAVNIQPTDATPSSGRLLSVSVPSVNPRSLTVYSTSETNTTFLKAVTQSSEILGCYDNQEAAILISKCGKGSSIMFGFNAEVTYHDDGVQLSDAEVDSITETVFVRDELILSILKRFGL